MANRKKKIEVTIFIIALTLAILSYYWKPEPRFDLKIIYDITNYYTLLDFSESIVYLFSRGEYITMFYLYVMSFFDNLSFVQVIPVFLFFVFIGTYLHNSITFSFNKNDAKWILLSLLVLLSRTSVLYIFSSFRFWLAFSLFLVLISNHNKKNRYFLFSTVLIHNSMILFLFIYLLTKLPLRKGFFTILIIFISLFLSAMLLSRLSVVVYQVGTVYELLRKIILYFQIKIIYSNQFLFSILEIFIYCFILSIFYKYTKNKNFTRLEKFTFLIALFSLITFGFKDLNFRLLEFLRFLMFPINIRVLIYSRKKNPIIFFSLILLIALIIIGGIYIQISIYKFDILPNMRTGGYYVN